VAGALAFAVTPAAPLTAASTPLTLQVPGRSSAHVSLAADGALVVAAWAASLPDGATDIYSAVSRDGGLTFSTPVRVNTTPGEARVNGEQPPRVALTSRQAGTPAITVVWTAKGPAGTRLQTARSTDGARTFSKSALVPGTDAAGNRGWEAMAADSQGQVHLAWLDHRRLAQADGAASSSAPMAHHEHAAGAKPAGAAAPRDGVAMAQLSELYVANLDGTAAPRGITGGVCYCCKTALTTTPAGTINIAWRHVYPGNLRDIAFASSKDGGRTFSAPLRVSEDRWQLDGCPDDGPAMAVDSSEGVHVIWPTLVRDSKQQQTIGLFYAQSRDGASFSPRIALPTEGLPHHPQVALVSGSLVMAWDELKDGARQLVTARASLGDRATRFTRAIVSGSTGGIYPSLAATKQGGVIAWTSGAGPAATVRVAQLGLQD
jgi:hypothetical protein